MLKGLEVQYLTIHGHKRAFVKAGSGPALLLLHGLGCDHTTWSSVIDYCHAAMAYMLENDIADPQAVLGMKFEKFENWPITQELVDEAIGSLDGFTVTRIERAAKDSFRTEKIFLDGRT